MKRFTLWNSYVAITESKEFVDWNKTKIIGSFKCPAFSYRSSTQIKADPFLFEYNNAIYLFYERLYCLYLDIGFKKLVSTGCSIEGTISFVIPLCI